MPTRALAAHVEAGKLRLLATWGEQRTAWFKDVPPSKKPVLTWWWTPPTGWVRRAA